MSSHAQIKPQGAEMDIIDKMFLNAHCCIKFMHTHLRFKFMRLIIIKNVITYSDHITGSWEITDECLGGGMRPKAEKALAHNWAEIEQSLSIEFKIWANNNVDIITWGDQSILCHLTVLRHPIQCDFLNQLEVISILPILPIKPNSIKLVLNQLNPVGFF